MTPDPRPRAEAALDRRAFQAIASLTDDEPLVRIENLTKSYRGLKALDRLTLDLPVMSHIASEVYSIERVRGLHERARSHLRPLRVSNLHLLFGDGMAGYAAGAPYAAIVSAAGGDAIPQAWVDQLAIGGRIIAPTSNASGAQQLLVIDKTASGVRQHALEAVHFVPLKSGVD